MLENYLRPLTTLERSSLEDEVLLFQKQKRHLLMGMILTSVLILAFGVPLVLQQAKTDPNLLYLGAAVLATYLAILVWVYREIVGLRGKRTRALSSALRRDQAQVLHCTTSRMLELPEIEDEGPAYLFEDESGRLLMLAGQLYYPTTNFPADDFQAVEILASDDIPVNFSIQGKGKRLKPVKRLSEETKTRLFDLLPAVDFIVIEESLEEIEQRIMEGSLKLSESISIDGRS